MFHLSELVFMGRAAVGLPQPKPEETGGSIIGMIKLRYHSVARIAVLAAGIVGLCL